MVKTIKLLLVPWAKGWGFALHICKQPAIYKSDIIEITTLEKKSIVVALLNPYPKRLCLYTLVHNARVAVEVDVPEEKAERLLRALNGLSKVNPSALKRKRARELLENPTLDKLERFLAIEKLLG